MDRAESRDALNPRGGSRLRAGTWLMHMALPLLALWLLLAQPHLDVAWDDRVAHIVLVLGTALVSVVLGVLMSRAARSRDDARLWLVSYVFISSSAFLGLHALVTPGVLVDSSDAGFMLPTRVGLLLAATAGLVSAFLLERLMAAGVDAFPRTDLRLGLVRAGELEFADEPAGPLARRAARTLEPGATGTLSRCPCSDDASPTAVQEPDDATDDVAEPVV